MNFPSSEAVRLLEFLRVSGDVPEDRLPAGYALELLPVLVADGFVVKFSILLPGMEPEYPYGLWGYRITSAGDEVLHKLRDAAQKEAKQNAKENRRAFWSAIKFWVGLIAGWILGGFTPQEVFQWISGLFQ